MNFIYNNTKNFCIFIRLCKYFI